MAKEYSIKISGSGSFAAIMNSLHSMAGEMELILESGKSIPDEINWEDETLITEITEEE